MQLKCKARTDAILDDLLCRWHQWQATSTTRGWAPKSLVCGDFRGSRQYDDANGQLDADLESQQMRTVDFEVREMTEPYRSAIYVQAKAFAIGAMVFASPRLPSDPMELGAVVQASRVIATERFTAAGLM